ncbi:MAG: flagellar assembly peptidoglycan hydrolase FlgJ [Legionella sp.]|nr:flagellar assembly peptidoglycan hydrolase FlgJ [Legionella sp.]
MSNDKVLFDSSVYTNLQGLGSLAHEYKSNSKAVKKEVSQQFESMLIQMLLKSMRDTNKEFNSEMMANEQSAMYHDLYDKQLALVLSKSGIGIAKNIEQYMDKNTEAVSEEKKVVAGERLLQPHTVRSVTPKLGAQPSSPVSAAQMAPTESLVSFASAKDFVTKLWDSAKVAAQAIGADPKILLAQAALETSWGKKIIPNGEGKTTHNLFNIKAGSQWTKGAAEVNAVEMKDGVLVKEPSKFRAYESFHASFLDFTHFLQSNNRYKEALEKAANPKDFVNALQKANYATDEQYSEKIMDIYNSKSFNNLIEESKLI